MSAIFSAQTGSAERSWSKKPRISDLSNALPRSVISTLSDFHNHANRCNDEFWRVRREKGLDSKGYDVSLTSVLADQCELVGKPVIERL
jgi:hypothetical protein